MSFGIEVRADSVADWRTVQPPPPPKLEDVTVDPKTTALVMIDFLKQNCAPNPRCLALLPQVSRCWRRAGKPGAPHLYEIPEPQGQHPGAHRRRHPAPVAPTGKAPTIRF